MNNLSMLIKSVSYETYSSNLYRTDSIELYLQLFFIKLSEKLHSRNDSVISSHYDRMSIIRSKLYSMPQHESVIVAFVSNAVSNALDFKKKQDKAG